MKQVKFERISARVHPMEKDKLKKTGYNARQAIEYFNNVSNNEVDQLNIEEYFLNKEVEELKYTLIAKEARLEDIQKKKNEIYKGNLSQLRIDSYMKIIQMYNSSDERTSTTNDSFEDFIEMNFIEKTMIGELSCLQCPLDEYKEGLLDYYQDVVLGSRTVES